MKQTIVTLLFILSTIVAYGQFQPTNLNNNVVYSGSKYASQVTPPTAINIQGQTQEEYLASQRNNIRRGFKPDPDDPYPTPVCDIPWILMISFVCVYLLSNKYKKE